MSMLAKFWIYLLCLIGVAFCLIMKGLDDSRYLWALPVVWLGGGNIGAMWLFSVSGLPQPDSEKVD